MAFGFEALSKFLQSRLLDFQATRVQGKDRFFAIHQVQGCASSGAGLGKYQRAVVEFKNRKGDSSRQLCLAVEPAQPARNHEMQHKKELLLEFDDDALAQSTNTDD